MNRGDRGSGAKERLRRWRQCGIVLAERGGQEAGNLGEGEQSPQAFAFHMWIWAASPRNYTYYWVRTWLQSTQQIAMLWIEPPLAPGWGVLLGGFRLRWRARLIHHSGELVSFSLTRSAAKRSFPFARCYRYLFFSDCIASLIFF